MSGFISCRIFLNSSSKVSRANDAYYLKPAIWRFSCNNNRLYDICRLFSFYLRAASFFTNPLRHIIKKPLRCFPVRPFSAQRGLLRDSPQRRQQRTVHVPGALTANFRLDAETAFSPAYCSCPYEFTENRLDLTGRIRPDICNKDEHTACHSRFPSFLSLGNPTENSKPAAGCIRRGARTFVLYCFGSLMDGGASPGALPQLLSALGPICSSSTPPFSISCCVNHGLARGLPLRVAD